MRAVLLIGVWFCIVGNMFAGKNLHEVFTRDVMFKTFAFDASSVHNALMHTPDIKHIEEYGQLSQRLAGQKPGEFVIYAVNNAIEATKYHTAVYSDNDAIRCAPSSVKWRVFCAIVPEKDADKLHWRARKMS